MKKSAVLILACLFPFVATAQSRSFSPTVVREDVTARALNSVAPQNNVALGITAHVYLGANPCMARGVDVRLSQRNVNGVVQVVAERRDPSEQRFCTQEYNPQYARLTTTVRGSKRNIRDVRVMNVGEMDNSVSLLSAPAVAYDGILFSATARAITPGFHPDSFAYRIEGEVELGTNSCFAQGKKAELQQVSNQDRITVKAVITGQNDPDRMCPMVYAPVYAKVVTEVRGFGTPDVTLLNVQEMGQHVSLESVLQN